MKGIAADSKVMTSRGDRLAAKLGPGMMLLAVTPGIAPFQRVIGIRQLPYRGPLLRVRPGVLGNMAPSEDLLLLPDQGVVFQGRAYRVADLADGVAIRREEAPPGFYAIDILLQGHAAIMVQGAALEVGFAGFSSAEPLQRVPVDQAISAHIALMATELELDEPPELPSIVSPSSLARPSVETLPASLKLPD
ncbi:MAG: hypothetical protein RLZZ57_2888 [Pseudomonadota bacterium]